MTNELVNQIAEVLHQTYETIGTTGRDFAYLGKVDGTVVVPQNEQIAAGAVWCHKEGLPPFQAILLSSSGITYDNTSPGLEVEVAYPPNYTQGKDPACVIGLSPRGMQEMGGLTPQGYGLLKSQNPQVENLITLRLTVGSGGMKVSMTGGWFRRGSGLFYLPSQDDIADLTDSIPATAGQRRYAIVCWDETANEAVVIEREPFDIDSAYVFSDQIAGEVTPGLLHLGYALLENDVSELTKNNVIPLQHLYQVPGVSISDRDPTESDDITAGYGVTWIWINNVAHRVFFLENSTAGAALWKNITGGSGAGGNEFENLFVQGANHQIILDSNGLYAARQNSTGSGIQQVTLGARGDLETPEDSQQNDIVFQGIHRGYGAGERDAAKRTVEITEATPGATAMGAKVQEWVTPEGSVTPIPAFNWTGERLASDLPFQVLSLTGAEIAALTPTGRWVVFNTTTSEYWGWDGSAWVVFSGSGSGGSSGQHVCEGRLSLTSGNPEDTADATGAGTIYFTPFKGNRVRLYDGATWGYHTFTERSLSLTLTSGSVYDVFLYDNSGTLTLEALVWTNTTTRATAVVYFEGVKVKSGASTRLWLGTIYATGTNTTEDSKAIRGVWNEYNPILKPMLKVETADNWNNNTAGWGPANGTTANRLQFVCGWARNLVEIKVSAGVDAGQNEAGAVGIGIDSTTANHAETYNEVAPGSVAGILRGLSVAEYAAPLLGFHYAQWVEYARAGTITFIGDNGVATSQSGIRGKIWC